jgi:hypothetical protein
MQNSYVNLGGGALEQTGGGEVEMGQNEETL